MIFPSPLPFCVFEDDGAFLIPADRESAGIQRRPGERWWGGGADRVYAISGPTPFRCAFPLCWCAGASTSFGITLPLFEFWQKAGFSPVYLRQGSPAPPDQANHRAPQNVNTNPQNQNRETCFCYP